ncbi:alpha/beta hydrolase [Streptomyces sp. NPDC091265]|uniref:alpha/beta hydrolase n=1 Tax=unclassified Streptomyces TaxID=2593676 RepID=UPI00344F9870
MRTSAERQKVRFTAGGTECAAWHYPGTNGGCVIMAGGGGVTKEPGTDPFAARFNDAGFTVLAFDYRRLGESGGRPRQTVRIKDQLVDWQSAISFAATLPDVDPARIAIWGFSLSGGHVLRVAARNPQLAAAIAQTPNADGPAASRNATRHQKPLAMLRLTGRALLDAAGGLLGRSPVLVPLAGEPGTVSMLTTPDAVDGDRALNPGNRYPQWQQTIAARSVFGIVLYRPGRDAPRIRGPLLVLVCDQDLTALSEPAVRAAGHAPRAELVRLPGGHYAPFLDQHEPAVRAELSFLRHHLLDEAPAGADAAATARSGSAAAAAAGRPDSADAPAAARRS